MHLTSKAVGADSQQVSESTVTYVTSNKCKHVVRYVQVAFVNVADGLICEKLEVVLGNNEATENGET